VRIPTPAPIIAGFVAFFCLSTSFAYDSDVAHPSLTKKAVMRHGNLWTFVEHVTGVPYSTAKDLLFADKRIVDWFRQGSSNEDAPACRASNHFYNPLEPWDTAEMSDDILSPLGRDIGLYCTLTGWSLSSRTSNATWATGLLGLAPDGPKESFATNPVFAAPGSKHALFESQWARIFLLTYLPRQPEKGTL